MTQWNSPQEPPAMRGAGIPSAPVLALLDNGDLIAAEFWQSALEGQPPKWYISQDVYMLLPSREITEYVVGWLELTAWEYTPIGLCMQTADESIGAFQRGKYAMLVRTK